MNFFFITAENISFLWCQTDTLFFSMKDKLFIFQLIWSYYLCQVRVDLSNAGMSSQLSITFNRTIDNVARSEPNFYINQLLQKSASLKF